MRYRFSLFGRHDQQNAVLPVGDGFNGFVDCLKLVITWRFTAAIVVIVLSNHRKLSLCVSFPEAEFCQSSAGREVIQRYLLFKAFTFGCGGIAEDKAITVGGKTKGTSSRRAYSMPCCIPLPISCLLAFASITAKGMPCL